MTSIPANSLANLSNSFAAAIAHAGQAIVTIHGGRRMTASGVHWQPGVVVTTDHALKHDEITVTLGDRSLPASLIGRDPGTDLALLKLSQSDIAVAEVGDSTQLQVGHLVFAVGRSPDSGVTASMGVIGAIGGTWRTWQGGQIDQYIRPDLSLYPGGAGSGLVDLNGRVVGINTSAPRSGVLTIPTTTVQRVIHQLLQSGRVVRGYLGVGMQPVALPPRLRESLGLATEGGVIIVSTEAGSPADQAGVIIGDVIVALDDRPIQQVHDVHAVLDPDRVGKPLLARLIRAGELLELTVVVGERPRRGV
ncbi:MAG: PDZ domain-containing protein [Leptolyngbyaceae cyanobacterium SL_7_1]|nr:PDZ domain-containing protein [Leptolyngbyaceae cyanobacterium SL_7_1]